MAEARTQSLLPYISALRVSSVQNSSREFGKANLIDGSQDTCWTSDQSHGAGQFIHAQFQQPVALQSFGLTFQGGFVGQPCEVHVIPHAERTFRHVASFDTRDINAPQSFPCDQRAVIAVKLSFPASTDQFGRVTVYDLQLHGNLESNDGSG